MSVPIPSDPVALPGEQITRLYLSTLRSSGSRRSMESSLRAVARLMAQASGADPDRVGAGSVDWAGLDWATATSIKALLRDRYAPATVNRHLAAIRGVVKVAHMTGLMDTDRAARCREGLKSDRGSYDGADPAGRLLSRSDMVAIFETLAEQPSVSARRDAAMFAILAMGGLRRAEVCGLDLADWNAPTGELLVRQGKGGRIRKVWLHEGGVEALQAWLTLRGGADGPLLAHVNKGGRITSGEAGRLSPHAVWKRTKRLASAARITDFAPHDFRRHMVTQLLDAGQDLVAVSRLAGHSQVTTTARYDRRGERAARKASAALDVPYVPPVT